MPLGTIATTLSHLIASKQNKKNTERILIRLTKISKEVALIEKRTRKRLKKKVKKDYKQRTLSLLAANKEFILSFIKYVEISGGETKIINRKIAKIQKKLSKIKLNINRREKKGKTIMALESTFKDLFKLNENLSEFEEVDIKVLNLLFMFSKKLLKIEPIYIKKQKHFKKEKDFRKTQFNRVKEKMERLRENGK